MRGHRFFMLVTALLYLGPLLAGLAGFGWAQVPAFACVFMLWLLVMRPQDWPRTAAGWREPRAILTLAARAAVQLLLVAVSFGIGRGLGGVLGFVPALPVWLPLLVSVAAIGLGWLMWNPGQAADLDAFLDEAIARIEAAASGEEEGETEAADVTRLLALPADAGDTAALAVLTAETDRQDTCLLRALRDALTDQDRSHDAARRAAILWATDPDVAREYLGYAALADAFDLAFGDPGLLRLFATRCMALLRADPSVWIDCPMSDFVFDAASNSADPELTDLLHELLTVMAQADPAREDPAGR